MENHRADTPRGQPDPLSARQVAPGAAGGARGDAPGRPVLVTREYRRQRQYERDRARLQREGWKVLSVLERPAQRGALERWTIGLSSAVAPPGPERLVTYAWDGDAPRPPRPVQWQPAGRLGRGPLRRRWWILAVALLILLLVIGLASFVIDLPV